MAVDNYGHRNPCSIFLRAVEEEEIINIVNKTKNKMSTDLNETDMKIVKNIVDGITKPLTHICNLSFQTGKFPSKMKIANTIPLYNTGDRNHFTNYKPVSLLSQFSMIPEKLFVESLDNFIEKHNLPCHFFH